MGGFFLSPFSEVRVRKGSLFGLLGSNGAGKTTTLRMLLRMLVPDEGSIQLFGESLTDHSPTLVGYLPEERGLYPRMKVRDNLLFLAGLKGVSDAKARLRCAQGRLCRQMPPGRRRTKSRC